MAMIPLIISVFLLRSLYSAAHISTFSLIMALLLLAIPVLVVINIVRKKVIVESDRISYTGPFTEKELPFLSIKGYRIGFKSIYLEPLLPGDPTIVISHYRDLENGRELMQWVREAFRDLNTADLASQHAMVLTNVRWGATEEARKKTLARVHTLALVYNIVSFPLVLTLLLENGKTALTLLLAYPLAGILLMTSSRGLIKFQSDKQRSICSFVLYGIFVPGFALLIKSTANYNVLDETYLWAPAVGIGALLFALIYVTGINKPMGMLRPQVVAMTLTALVYGFGCTLQVNSVFDPALPAVYDVAILDSHRETTSGSRITGDENTSYRLTLCPWGPLHEPQVVSVPERLYWQSKKGDTVQVRLGEGLLHIPWFVVNNNEMKIGEKKK